ncbi:long-chain-fatty-acyl-CoA reductase [Nocardia vinacea]|uniref:Long-chain-fatty-acyl-CoA reductase n=1 Tax=Nocardia vinacea TaxID=96468 RepID=A0ABZ1YQX3_9NOCA|nr:acyl-CoA reductase [Nocardia vinacea]
MSTTVTEPAKVWHVERGVPISGTDRSFGSGAGHFVTPRLDLDALVWPRNEPGPAFDTSVAEIIDVLTALGSWLEQDPDGLVEAALQAGLRTNPLPAGVLREAYAGLHRTFSRQSIDFMIEQELGGTDVLDGWRTVARAPSGRTVRVRAFPARVVHILAGNAPGVSALSLLRGALTKGVNLFKLPSNDLFSAGLLLNGLHAVAPGHPTTRSFSVAYWRGGDTAVESVLFRPQFFDKLAAWGGESALRGAKAYIGPGFELVSFDPKSSISLVGREAFASEQALLEAAEAAARDIMIMDQQACAASRFQYVEGGVEEADRFAAALLPRLGVARRLGSAVGNPVPTHIRDEIEVLRDLAPYAQVFGRYDGHGLVVRTEEPVDFHPENKVANVVPVAKLEHALERINVATQSVGVYPASRKPGLRDRLASAGAARICTLGDVPIVESGLPHDGFYPLQRLVRWVSDEG